MFTEVFANAFNGQIDTARRRSHEDDARSQSFKEQKKRKFAVQGKKDKRRKVVGDSGGARFGDRDD